MCSSVERSGDGQEQQDTVSNIRKQLPILLFYFWLDSALFQSKVNLFPVTQDQSY